MITISITGNTEELHEFLKNIFNNSDTLSLNELLKNTRTSIVENSSSD